MANCKDEPEYCGMDGALRSFMTTTTYTEAVAMTMFKVERRDRTTFAPHCGHAFNVACVYERNAVTIFVYDDSIEKHCVAHKYHDDEESPIPQQYSDMEFISRILNKAKSEEEFSLMFDNYKEELV